MSVDIGFIPDSALVSGDRETVSWAYRQFQTISDVTSRTRDAINQFTDGYKSVKDFGAVGDGSTDDTAALAAAQVWLATQTDGAVLFFPVVLMFTPFHRTGHRTIAGY